MTQTGRLLTVQDVASMTGKSPRTVLRWADSGALAVAQRLPGKNGTYLFTRSAVDALLASGAVTRTVPVTQPIAEPESAR